MFSTHIVAFSPNPIVVHYDYLFKLRLSKFLIIFYSYLSLLCCKNDAIPIKSLRPVKSY